MDGNDLSNLCTEGINPETLNLDQMSTLDLVAAFNREDAKLTGAVAEVLPVLPPRSRSEKGLLHGISHLAGDLQGIFVLAPSHPRFVRAEAGRVMTGTYLACEDPVLRQVWDAHIREMEAADDESWIRQVTKILSRLGFSVIR